MALPGRGELRTRRGAGVTVGAEGRGSRAGRSGTQPGPRRLCAGSVPAPQGGGGALRAVVR